MKFANILYFEYLVFTYYFYFNTFENENRTLLTYTNFNITFLRLMEKNLYEIYNLCYLEASRGAVLLYDRQFVGSIRTRLNKIFIYIFISSLWCRGKARC